MDIKIAPDSINYRSLPLFVKIILTGIVAFVPLIVYMYPDFSTGVTREILEKKDAFIDLFTYYKMVWLILLTFGVFVWYLQQKSFLGEGFIWLKQPLIIYSCSAIIATVFSVHKDLSIRGDYYRYEGLLVHISYMVIVYLFAVLIRKKKDLEFVFIGLLVSSSLIGIVGLLQFSGFDPIFSKLGTELFVPFYLRRSLPADFALNSSESKLLIGLTFGNTNFAGSFLSMIYSLTLGFFLGGSGLKKLFLLLANSLIYFNLLGTCARSAIYSGIIGGTLLLFLFRNAISRQLRWLALLACIYIVIPFAMDAYTLKNGLPRFFSTSLGRSTVYSVPYGNFEDIIFDGDNATVVFDGTKLVISIVDGKIGFFDLKKQAIPYRLLVEKKQSEFATSETATSDLLTSKIEGFQSQSSTGGAYSRSSLASNTNYLVSFSDYRFSGFLINSWPDLSVLKISRGGVSLLIGHTNDGFKLLDAKGRPTDLLPVETWGFKGYEGFASNRGYIWSRSLPMLKRTVLFGHGPDTYMAHFPNHDYLGKLRVWPGGLSSIVEKPHNLFLQIALNIGFIALLAVISLWVFYFKESVRVYFAIDFSNQLQVYGVSIFCAIVTYLVNSMFNDSIVGIAQIFWALLGMGFAANRMVIAERAEKKSQLDESGPVAVVQES